MRTAPKTKGTRNAVAKAMKSNSCHRSEIPKSQEHSHTQKLSTGEQMKTDTKRQRKSKVQRDREREVNNNNGKAIAG